MLQSARPPGQNSASNVQGANIESKGKILVVLHQARSSPGRLGQGLEARGFQLDIKRPVLGDPLPKTMDEHQGAIIFGGPPSANDPDDYIKTEIDWIGTALQSNKPFWGICLGAQMLCKHLGCCVGPADNGEAEVGYYPLKATQAGEAFLPHWPNMIYQWHREGFELSNDMTLLATSDGPYANQAFQINDNVFGFQFHVELTYAMLNRWVILGRERFKLPGAQGREEHIRGRLLYDHMTIEFLDKFLDHWTALCHTD